MEIQRFDAIVRQLSQGGTRRRLLGLFGGTALGGLIAAGLNDDADSKKRKKKKKRKKRCRGGCQACETCVRGACQPVANGTVCGQSGCTVCVDGTCQAVANGSSCDQGGCKTCTDGSRQDLPDGTTCSAGRCQSGSCRCSGDVGCPENCFCGSEFPTGLGSCWAFAEDPCNLPGNCDTDSDCDPGEACMKQQCFGPIPYGVCYPVCTG